MLYVRIYLGLSDIRTNFIFISVKSSLVVTVRSDGIKSKRNNAGRIPKISSARNKERIEKIISKSPRNLSYVIPTNFKLFQRALGYYALEVLVGS
jgi:hypothetical protein